MASDDHPTRSASIRRFAVVGFLAILLLVALLGAILLSPEDVGGPTPTVRQSSAKAYPTSTTLETRAEVVERLRKILEIRDKAFRERNAEMLEDIYTVDCPCLEGDRNAINELTANNYHMVGGATSVRIREVNQVSARLWLVVADFRSAPLRIEAKDNKLVHA